jgi:peptidyl-prolyl cis-trans isomerase SurA
LPPYQDRLTLRHFLAKTYLCTLNLLRRLMKRLLLLCIVLFPLASFAQSLSKAKPATLFTVGGTPTSTDEFIYLFKKNHANKAQDFTEAKIDEYLNLFINFKLKIKEAHQRGLDTTAKFDKELKTYRDELKKPYRAEKNVLDKLTKETYDHLTQEIKAAHILVQVKSDASPDDTLKAYNKLADIKKRIEAGESFEKLARELSEDPSAKYNGGSLGYFTAMQMVYPFEAAAYQTKVGEISSIVRTRFGYHIIKVEDKKPSRGEVEVSHILLRAAPGNDAKIKNLIFEIYDQLKNGRSWDELCKEYSEDTNTKNAGGKLRPFGVGTFPSIPDFESTAFALQNPGDISDPFQTSVGWHIVRLEKKIPMPPYAEVEASLKKRVARDERMKISEEAVLSSRRKLFGLKENSENKKKVMALADSSLLKGKWKFTGSAELKNLPLFTVNNVDTKADEFFRWIERHQSATTMAPVLYINQLYDALVEEKISVAEDEKIIKENPEFQHLLAEYREGILLFEIMEKEIWNKASEDTLSQKKFYKENIAKYAAGDRVEARIFSTSDGAFFEKVKKKIAQADTLTKEDMKKFKSIQNFRNYEKGESKIVDKVNWVPGLQETSIDGVYYLVEIKRLVAPGTKTFEEARAHIISDYQDSLEKSWVAGLKNKYHVAVNKKGKKVVLNELIKK